ncbi:MAG: hypothetical protein MI923_01970 [Phycisphaerales bacterium]|nr:hypothetical protein [Phycisphaerales bacterium]
MHYSFSSLLDSSYQGLDGRCIVHWSVTRAPKTWLLLDQVPCRIDDPGDRAYAWVMAV